MMDHLEITLCGDRDLAGEIVFEGHDAMKIRSATIDDEAVEVVHDGKRAACIYGHANRKEFTLNYQIQINEYQEFPGA